MVYNKKYKSRQLPILLVLVLPFLIGIMDLNDNDTFVSQVHFTKSDFSPIRGARDVSPSHSHLDASAISPPSSYTVSPRSSSDEVLQRRYPHSECRSTKENLPRFGPKPLIKKYPQSVKVADDALTDNGYGAHRRRSETWSSVGISANALRNEVANKVPEVAGISTITICRMFVAPNKRHAASVRFKGVIDGKIGTKENDISKPNPDSHYCRMQVKYAMEMGACFDDEIQLWSADDKNKLMIGGGSPVVSRYVGFGTYFKKGDEYHTSDHNFSTGYNTQGAKLYVCWQTDMASYKNVSYVD